MRRTLLAVTALLAACHTSPSPSPPPQPPDASDAAPAPVTSTCAAACANISTLCGPQPADCAAAMSNIEHDRLMRSPDGSPITCARVAAAQTKAAMQAAGVGCP